MEQQEQDEEGERKQSESKAWTLAERRARRRPSEERRGEDCNRKAGARRE